MATAQFAAPYPVTVEVQPATEPRNKLTIGFRLILAIPHLLLVGGLGFATSFSFWWNDFGGLFALGVLGAVALVCAVVSWFAILFANQHPPGLRDLCLFYLRWRTRALAYMALFHDQYPPFGDAEYPASINVVVAEGERDKVSVGLRFFYLIPHLIIVGALSVAWTVTSIIAWFSLLINDTYPEGLYNFGLGVMRWSLRVEAYALLLVDEYPPFSLD